MALHWRAIPQLYFGVTEESQEVLWRFYEVCRNRSACNSGTSAVFTARNVALEWVDAYPIPPATRDLVTGFRIVCIMLAAFQEQPVNSGGFKMLNEQRLLEMQLAATVARWDTEACNACNYGDHSIPLGLDEFCACPCHGRAHGAVFEVAA